MSNNTKLIKVRTIYRATDQEIDGEGERKASTRSGIIGYVEDGMHEAHVALMLRDSLVHHASGVCELCSKAIVLALLTAP